MQSSWQSGVDITRPHGAAIANTKTNHQSWNIVHYSFLSSLEKVRHTFHPQGSPWKISVLTLISLQASALKALRPPIFCSLCCAHLHPQCAFFCFVRIFIILQNWIKFYCVYSQFPLHALFYYWSFRRLLKSSFCDQCSTNLVRVLGTCTQVLLLCHMHSNCGAMSPPPLSGLLPTGLQ